MRWALKTTRQLLITITYFCLSAMTADILIKQQEGKQAPPGTADYLYDTEEN